MLSPQKPYYRQPPPVKPSKSLEGLEVVVPPGTFFISQSDISVDIFNKPLPAKPLPETPERSPSLYSHDSLLETFIYRTSTETTDDSHIPVASDLDDFSRAITRPATAGHLSTRPSLAQLSRDKVSSLSLKAFMTQERFGGDIHARIKAGPYFREKKWDFFPELATPSGLQATTYPGRSNGLKRRLRGRKSPVSLPASLEFGRSGTRWLAENKALVLGHGIRDSIRSCMQKTTSRKKSYEQNKQKPNARSNHPYAQRPAYDAMDSKAWYETSKPGPQQDYVDVYDRMRTLSISPDPSCGSSFSSSQSRTLVNQSSRQQLYPTESYEDYGFKTGGDLLLYRRASYSKDSYRAAPKPPRRTSSMIEMRKCTCINPTPPLPQPRSAQLQQQTQQYVKALHNGTSQMISALDGAKKKLMETKADRRRAELKKQIKMVGPVDPWRHAGVNYLL
ncbi:8-oxo-dGTP diphosphatase [Paecilomyces lecythidis]|uniref:8-oxo-dGTP diphosphatase n=1 Tax=Paecilomyces lecythidis TaxID=3004212 RepID=A0ABR3X0S8_9EURO